MAATSSTTPAVTVEKSMTYRGAREHWSNTYHIDQLPPNQTDWLTLAQNIWSWEQAFLSVDVQVEKYFGHTAGTPPVLVFEYDSPPTGEGGATGTYTPATTMHDTPGDAAMWLRWGTTQKTSRGKPIYLRNYYHDPHTGASSDTIDGVQTTAMMSFGQAFQNGIVVAGVTYRRAGPRGAIAQSHAVSPYITTRTLKHRGKRKRVTQSELDTVKDALLHSLERSLLGPILGG